MGSEARPVLRASGARRPSKRGKARRNSETRPEPERHACFRPPRRGLRSPSSSPRPAGRGASTKDSNFRAGAGPPRQLLAQAGPAGRKRAGNARAAGSWRGWAGPATQGGGWDEGQGLGEPLAMPAGEGQGLGAPGSARGSAGDVGPHLMMPGSFLRRPAGRRHSSTTSTDCRLARRPQRKRATGGVSSRPRP